MNNFNFFVPIDEEQILKSSKKTGDDRYKNMVLSGMASDNTKDLEEEILEPVGYVTDVFLKSGHVNYEHLSKKSPKFIIGEPIDAQVKGDKFFIKAKLFSKSQLARDTWDKIIEMNESGSTRKAGWSIEGKALQRDPLNPKRITKALITNVALTFNPVNQNTYADIAKGVQKQDFVEPVYEERSPEEDYIFQYDLGDKFLRINKSYDVFFTKKETIKKGHVDFINSARIINQNKDFLKKIGEFDKILQKMSNYFV